MIVRPSDIIHHIIGEELEKGYTVIDTTTDLSGKTGLDRARAAHTDWKMAFSVNKKINSKNLIEAIAKETKMFPFLKGDKLSFNSIKDTYSDGDENFLLKDEDVISIKFDRTKIEDLKTKVVLHYHFDYADDKYLYSTESLNIWQTAFDMFENGEESYDNLYYGIPVNEEVGSDPIEIKYIRHQGEMNHNDETITKLHQFLLSWYCNQHNICQIKLPLKYLNIEIGDIAAFPKLINGRLAYGEDYSLNNDNPTFRNEQQILPYWMVKTVSRSLDSVTLDLIQMHRLVSSGMWIHPDHPPGGQGSGVGSGWLYGVNGMCSVYFDYFSWVFEDNQIWEDDMDFFALLDETPYPEMYPPDDYPYLPLTWLAYDPLYNGGQFHIHLNCPGQTWVLYFFPEAFTGTTHYPLDFITATKSGSDEIYTCNYQDNIWFEISNSQACMRIEGYGYTTITCTVPERTQADFESWDTAQYAIGNFFLAVVDGGVETNAFPGLGIGHPLIESNTSLMYLIFASFVFSGWENVGVRATPFSVTGE